MEKGSTPNPSPLRSRLLIALGATLFVVTIVVAFMQNPADDPYIEDRSLVRWFFSPIESNPQMRLPNAGGTITAIATVPGTGIVRAVGARGLAIVSGDGGRTWRADTVMTRAQAIIPPARPAGSPAPLIDTARLPVPTGAVDMSSDGDARGWRFVRANYENDPEDPKPEQSGPPKGPNDPYEGKGTDPPIDRSGYGDRQTEQRTRERVPVTDLPASLDPSQRTVTPRFDPATPNTAGIVAPPTQDSIRSTIVVPDYTAIVHVDEELALAAGAGGVLLRTTDGGARWERTDFALPAGESVGAIVSMAFRNRMAGCALDAGGVLVHTRDGGMTWSRSLQSPYGLRPHLRAVAALGELFVAVGDDGAIMESPDGGATWRTVGGGLTTRNLHGVAFSGTNAGIAVGDAGTIVRYDGSRWSAASPADSVALRSVLMLDERRAIAAGDSGRVLVSSDGGATWARPSHPSRDRFTQIALNDDAELVVLGDHNALFAVARDASSWTRLMRPFFLRTDYAFASSMLALALRTDGVVMRSSDAGLSWSPVDAITGRIDEVAMNTRAEAIAVGAFGQILRSDDGGASWAERPAPLRLSAASVAIERGGSAWAIGAGPGVVSSSDAGNTWTLRVAPRRDTSASGSRGGGWRETSHWNATAADLFILDGPHVWASIADTLLRTTDGGATWRGSSRPKPGFDGRMVFATPTHGWIGGDGAIARTTDGGRTWSRSDARVRGRIVALHFDDAKEGWGVGENGAIVATRNGGRSWRMTRPPQPNGDVLIAVTRVDGDLVAAGLLGTVLRSDDDGETWSRPSYGWFPAPWFFVSILVLIALAAWLRQKPEPPPPARTIADILANDRPLEAGEPDALDLGSRALHLSTFIRNRKTEPPMTFAVTGRWGSGKSSLMNLLKSDLERHGHRPVWFNAWHHQGEQHLLAALFENVRRQAIPPIADLHGVRFRARLLLGRLRRFAPMLGPAFLLFAISGGYFIARPEELGRIADAIGGVLESIGQWFTAETPEDLPAVQATEVKTNPGVGGIGAFSVFTGSALMLLNLTLRGLVAFGIAPAVMLRKFSEGSKLKDLEEMTGFRYQFQREFEEVTNAMRERTMVIIIDDLDRCQPENVLEVLEAVNFLVSSGRVHVILGMDKQRVLDYVRAGYEGNETNFAEKYMQKLVNVEVSIPPPTPAAARAIVDTEALERHVRILEHRRTVERRLRRARTALTFLLIASIGLPVYWLARRAESTSEPAKSALPAVVASVAPAPASAPVADSVDGAVALGTLPQAPAAAAVASTLVAPPASLTDGEDGALPWIPFGIPLGLFALVVALSFADRPVSNLTDSRDFSDALDIWLPVITSVDNTPRSLKRFVNHVRFLAMQGRVATADPTLWERLVDRCCREQLPTRDPAAPPIGDAHVVAIEAARYLAPDVALSATWFGPSGPGPVAAAGDGSALGDIFERARDAHVRRWGAVPVDAAPAQYATTEFDVAPEVEPAPGNGRAAVDPLTPVDDA